MGVVLDKRINGYASSWEVGNHVGLSHDDLSIQNVIVSIVATVHNKGKIYNQSRCVAVAVSAGIWLVGWQAVVGQKLRVALTIDDDTPTGAFHFRSKVNPAACIVQLLILDGVRVTYIDVTGVEETTQASFSVYPLPAENEIQIQTESFQKAEVFSLTGQKLMESQQSKMNVSALASGVYLLKVYDQAGKAETQRIVVK